MPLIAEVTVEVEQLFLRFRKWGHLQEAIRREENEGLRDYQRRREEEIKHDIRDLDAHDTEAYFVKANQDIWDREEEKKDINGLILASFNRLRPATYPKDDPETPRLMYELLSRIARSYASEGVVRSAGPILEYLLKSIDHTWWLWRQWISSCLVVGDYASAECLLVAAQEHTEFAGARGHHGHWLCAKALVHYSRDEDIELAIDYADRARRFFGDSAEGPSLWKALRNLDKHNGHAQLTDEHSPAKALITGDWNDVTVKEGQAEHTDEQHEALAPLASGRGNGGVGLWDAHAHDARETTSRGIVARVFARIFGG